MIADKYFAQLMKAIIEDLFDESQFL